MKVGIFGLMFLIMFALKLAGPLATASWWIITLPLYGPLLAMLAFFIFVGAIAVLADKR